jgi:hypothetical protein
MLISFQIEKQWKQENNIDEYIPKEPQMNRVRGIHQILAIVFLPDENMNGNDEQNPEYKR